MLLTFSRKFPWGDPTDFEAKIQAGVKIHTLRGKGGLTPGMAIHLWMGSPRNPSNNPKEFFLTNRERASVWLPKADRFGKHREYPACSAVEKYYIYFPQLVKRRTWKTIPETIKAIVKVEGLQLNETLLDLLAKNDGFDNSRDFLKWFFIKAIKDKKSYVVGEIKHWTDFRYAG